MSYVASTTTTASRNVITTFLENPKAIAIVLGHLGADITELTRLSKFYVDRQCSVVAARSPPLDFFLAQHGRLKPIASKILKETESLIRQLPQEGSAHKNPGHNIPVVIHMWSNGGTFLWEELMKDPDLDRILLPRLQCVTYDSCPCYLHMIWRLGPYWNDAFPFPGWSALGRKIYLVGAGLGLSLWCLLTCSLRRSDDFWTQMRNPPCEDLMYLYSINDKVTDASRIEQLMEEQRTKQGKSVTAFKFEDADHVQLDRLHPQDYARAIDEALERACGRQRAVTEQQ